MGNEERETCLSEWAATSSQVSSTQNQPFQYQALENDRDIRLLRAHWDKSSNRTIWKISHVSLDSHILAYEAISYCWGDVTIKERIWVADKEYLEITESAAGVLQFLITKEISGYIWIDALCINQEDLDERGRQVRLMRDIFASARCVIAWVGNYSENSDLAVEFIGNVAKRIKELEEKEKNFGKLSIAQIWEALPHNSDPGWKAFKILIDRPWFDRLWIIQEMVVARRRVLACGTSAVAEWHELISILEYISEAGLSLYYLTFARGNRMNRVPVGGIKLSYIAYYSNAFRAGDLPKFQQVLINFCSSQTSDPRDKVFALLGLASDVQDPIFNPNYKSTPQDIFTKVCLYLMVRDRDLILLHSAGLGAPRMLEDLPSWVPDWSVTDIYNPLSTFVGMNWQAGGFRSQVNIHRHLTAQNVIVLSGSVLDSVNTTATPYPTVQGITWEDEKQHAFRIITMFEDWANLVGNLNAYPTAESSYQAYWRCFLCNIAGGRDAATPIFSDYCQDFLDHHKLLIDCATKEDWEQRQQRAQSTKGFTTFSAAISLTRDRILFTTAHGYAGKGPNKNVSPGDKICIFFGARTPFIIRPNPRHEDEELTYTLIGDCYIHGLMDGEGLDMGVAEDIILV